MNRATPVYLPSRAETSADGPTREQRPAPMKGTWTSAPWRTAAGVAAATLGVVVMDPQHRHVPLCPFHAATGWWCPLCGGLRATNALAHGNWLAALHDNVVFVASIPLLVWLWVDWVRRTHRGLGPRRMSRLASVVLVLVLVVFTVVRNLPAASALRP